MKYESSHERFTIFPEKDAAPVNQYRVHNRDLEFRVVDTHAHRFRSHWRKLTPDEIALHMNLNTAVAEWLNARLLRRAGLPFMPLELSLREATAVARSGR